MQNAIPKICDSEALSLRDPQIRPPQVTTDEFVRRAETAMRAMRPRQAIEIMLRAIVQAPSNPDLRYDLGRIQQVAGLCTASAASFRTAAMLAPWSLVAMGGLSSALEELGEWDEVARMRAESGLILPVVHRMRGAAPRTIALTIDDGPTPQSTPSLLSELRRAKVKASFFLNGERAERHPALVEAIAADGHDVLNHGYSHRRVDDAGCDPIEELERTEAVLSQSRPPSSPNWIRLPFGSGWLSAALHRRLKAWRRDTVLVQWTRHFYEWEIPERCAGKSEIEPACREAVAEGLRVTPPAGTTFLIHDMPIGVTSPLAPLVCLTMLREFLAGLAERNLAATSLSGILATTPPPAAPGT